MREAKGRVLLDTDVVIDFFTGREPMASEVARLLADRRACLSAVSGFELRAGVVGAKRLAAIATFLAAVEIIPVGAPEAERASSLYTASKIQGRTIGNADLLIAGTALEHGWPLLTRNVEHFGRVEGLRLALSLPSEA
jgi:tRNA(fMet)-specific endonuclease VapC